MKAEPPSSAPGMTRRQQRERTRRIILRAAIEVFAELGFEAASMGGIARRAQVKKALVQYHFETKEKLWQAAMLRLWQQLENAFPQYLDSVDSMAGARDPQSVRHVFRQIIRFVMDHPAWAGILFRESAQPGPRLDWLVEHCLRGSLQEGVRFVETAQEHGVLPPGEPLYLLHILSGALVYVQLVAPMTERALGVSMASSEGIETLLDTFMGLLGPRSSPRPAGNSAPDD